MAKVIGRGSVTLSVQIELTEDEAGAIDALFGYGIDAFLSTFYEKMGRAYLGPHEAGLRSLHEHRGFLSGVLRRAQEARKVFTLAQPQSPEAPATTLHDQTQGTAAVKL